jgi:hypothetical protein
MKVRRGILSLAVGVALALTAAVGSDRAEAQMEVTEFNTQVSTSQAGGHPDVSYKTVWTMRADSDDPCNCEDVKIIDTHFPTGFIGSPNAIPRCELAEFATNTCPIDAQVGVLDLQGFVRVPIFNMEPHPGEPGLVGFNVPLARTPAFVVLHGRTGSDYGLDATSGPIYHLLPFNELTIHLWGVPGLSTHDVNRFPPESFEGIQCEPYPGGCFPPVSTGITPAPYLQNPTTCGVPLSASVDVIYYQGTVASATSPWPATTGCDYLSFDPSLTAQPTTKESDTASGLDIDLNVPQPQSASAPSPSQIKEVTLTLPKGFSLVPNGANGKTACADEDLLFESENEAQCPEFAKIGTTTIDSSALPGPIYGGAYIGQPLPGQTFRLFVTADGYATHVKLKGTIELDPATGRIVTSFPNLPQSPIQGFDLHFFGSERGIFGTPTKCGSYPVEAEFVPWNSALPNQTSTSFFNVDTGPGGAPCPGATRPFAPQVKAGSVDNTAGAYSPFTLELSRQDGDQNLTGLTVTAPPGFLASLRGVEYCPEAALAKYSDPTYKGLSELAQPACQASSRVGSVSVAVGPGTRPVYVDGKVFLAGPYKGMPLSLVVALPAVSGPYDLGNVPIRVAVNLDPITGQVTTVSDPFPQILEGVPLRTRYAQIRFDRPDFTLNPTNCDPFAVESVLSGDEGGISSPSSHFQVANCAGLDFAPKLSMRLTGGLNQRGHPAIHAYVKAAPGEANIKRVSVTLPKGELLDNEHIDSICTRVQFAADECPAGSRLGSASATTPLLDQPLSGNVYLRTNPNAKLPDLVLDLRGQVDIELSARIDAVNGRLRTSFESVPDAPVSSVELHLAGGSKGLLINSESLCVKRKRATARMIGQNGARHELRPKLKVSCNSAQRRKARANRKGVRG